MMIRLLMNALFCAVICVGAMQTATAATGQPAAAAGSAKLAVSAPRASKPRDTFPVRVAGIDIINIATSPIGSLTPGDRAGVIEHNILGFASGREDAQSLKVMSLPEGLGIGNSNEVLMVITPEDAKRQGVQGDVLARETLDQIRLAVEKFRTKRAWKTYGLSATFSILAIIALWQALYWNNRAFHWLAGKTSMVSRRVKRGIRLKGVILFSPHQIDVATLLVLKSLRIVVALLCLYFFVPLILSFFPQTHELSTKIFGYFTTPFVTIFRKLLVVLPNLFYIFVIGLIAHYALKVISFFFTLIEREQLKFDWFYSDWARPTYQIVRFLVIVIALISAYPYIPGSSSQAFQGIGLVLGAIISFASSSAISNIVSGIILTYTRAFKLNDRIKVGETVGDVVEKTLLVTRINTIKEVIVTIPNSLVMGSQIINYSTSATEGGGVILHTSVTIGYNVPWKVVNDLLISAARATGGILETPEPFVLQTSLDDYYVSYEINAYTRQPASMAMTYSELHRNILDKFDEAGVEIMSPHYYSLRDGNASTVPSVVNGKGYDSPPFKVSGGPT
jgi:small-conductance mechanosensitive channel